MPVSTLKHPDLRGYLPLPGGGGVRLPDDVWTVSDVLEATGVKKAEKVDVPLYKEPLAKDILSPEDRKLKLCGRTGVLGHCKNGHEVVKLIVCHREWCPRCGQKGSESHKRRIARWLPKVRKMEKIGYWDIEFPNSSRSKYATKYDLSEFGKRAVGVFKSLGYDRGLRRWHFFGDKQVGKYNPHLNVFTDGGYIKKKDLNRIKKYMRFILDEPYLIVNYSYKLDVVSKVSTLEYVTRATFLDRAWYPSLARDLHNFRNCSYWGKWDGPDMWSLDDLPGDYTKYKGDAMEMDEKKIEKLQTGCCPECGEKMIWRHLLNSKEREYLIMLKVRKRGYSMAGKSKTDLQLLKEARGLMSEDFKDSIKEDILNVNYLKTAPNIVNMDIVEKIGIPLGAGYYRLPDTPKRADDT